MTELLLTRMIGRIPDGLHPNCQRIVGNLPAHSAAGINIGACDAPVGGGLTPDVNIPVHAISIAHADSEGLAGRLSPDTPAVRSRVIDDSFVLGLRSFDDSDRDALSRRVNEVSA